MVAESATRKEDKMSRLQTIIDRAGVTDTYIAEHLGMSRTTLYSRLNGETEFKPSEIACLRVLLHLTDEEILDIFMLSG